MPWLTPSDVEFVPMTITLDQIGLSETKEDIDLLLSSITQEPDIDTELLVNALLDTRNSVK